ncbi:MAG: maleate cis-trans isomerase [Rhodoglobus sp.]|nr:maleate cis-trans isomerase [Rhodoglobus sp.]
MRVPSPHTEAYGWRARIGLILPADNVLMEPELNSLTLPGVSFHGLRLTATEPEAMRRQAVDQAIAIRELGLDAAVYACAETSFNGGASVRESLAETIERECGVPVVTATNALLAALEHAGAERLALATPYSSESGNLLEATLTEHGYHVTSSLHRDFSLESEDPRVWYLTNRQPATLAYGIAKSVDTPDADTVVIVSTNFATLQIIERLEADLGKRVITTNQSILWWCLRTLRIHEPNIGIGRMLTDPSDVAVASNEPSAS